MSGVSNHSDAVTIEQALEQYVSSLSEIEKLTLEVAKRQLQSSFEINKSIGFIKYLKDNNISIKINND
jgi:hypothetical protein